MVTSVPPRWRLSQQGSLILTELDGENVGIGRIWNRMSVFRIFWWDKKMYSPGRRMIHVAVPPNHTDRTQTKHNPPKHLVKDIRSKLWTHLRLYFICSWGDLGCCSVGWGMFGVLSLKVLLVLSSEGNVNVNHHLCILMKLKLQWLAKYLPLSCILNVVRSSISGFKTSYVRRVKNVALQYFHRFLATNVNKCITHLRLFEP